MTPDSLLKWNTGLDEDCQELYVGYSYCSQSRQSFVLRVQSATHSLQ